MAISTQTMHRMAVMRQKRAARKVANAWRRENRQLHPLVRQWQSRRSQHNELVFGVLIFILALAAAIYLHNEPARPYVPKPTRQELEAQLQQRMLNAEFEASVIKQQQRQ